MYASVKIDGCRVLVNGGRTWTRSSKVVPNKFSNKILSTFEGLDGEYVIGKPYGPKVFERSSSGFKTIEGEPDFSFYVFDSIRKHDYPATYRLDDLTNIVRELDNHRIIILEQRLVESMDEVDAFYNKALDDGYEGVMLRSPYESYKFGKGTAKEQILLKLKPWADSEAKVIKVVEGTTNLNEAFINEAGLQARSSHQENKIGAGTAGSIWVMDIYSGVEFSLSLGSMTHEEHQATWDVRDELEGESATLTYTHFPIGVKDKPRMNRFKAWRPKVDIDHTLAKFL